MTTEWLALWVHFLARRLVKSNLSMCPPAPSHSPIVHTLVNVMYHISCVKWSGILTMSCSLGAWREIGVVTARSTKNSPQAAGARSNTPEVTKSRRSLLRIAAMVSMCLLLNAIAALSTAAKLEEWGRTADLSLACAIKETWNTRDWNAYGFNENDAVSVCSEETAIQVQGPCLSDCFWHPYINDGTLTCHSDYGVGGFESLEAKAEKYQQEREAGLREGPGPTNGCDCECSDLVQIERPRFVSSIPLKLPLRSLFLDFCTTAWQCYPWLTSRSLWW